MINWKRPLSEGPRIPAAPVHFCGTLREYVDLYLLPALPDIDVAIAWHKAVAAHATKPGSLLLVRSTPGFKQEDETTTKGGRQLRMTDNAPPWWIHAAAFSGVHPPIDGLAGILDDIWCWMFRAHKGGSAGSGQANGAGWYIAHILRAKPGGDGAPEGWDDTTAQRRFLRNLSPLNQFLVPKGNGADIGERAVVIATIANLYRSRYGEVFEQFLEEAGLEVGEIGCPAWDHVIEMAGPNGLIADPEVAMASIVKTRLSPPALTDSITPIHGYWHRILEQGQTQNRRAAILGAAVNSSTRLAQLTNQLTVQEFVGVANALFNQCDPTDLEAAAPRDLARQANLAWQYLDSAKVRPNLGGKWAKCVIELRPSSSDGLSALATLSVDNFVSAALRVVSQVYRKI